MSGLTQLRDRLRVWTQDSSLLALHPFHSQPTGQTVGACRRLPFWWKVCLNSWEQGRRWGSAHWEGRQVMGIRMILEGLRGQKCA